MRTRKIKESTSRQIFNVVNIAVMLILSFLCIMPFVYALAVSFSDKNMVSAGLVTFWPRGFTTVAYEYLLGRAAFWKSFEVASVRLILGTTVNMILIMLTAYPLSKDSRRLTGRTFYTWFFFVTMLISGGLIPSYILISNLGLRNTIWALIFPGALPVFNLVLMLNFFRTVPDELEEAAMIDGAGQLRTLVQIYIPVSKPAIASISLFCMVNHWNAWFDGLIYMNTPDKVPLQTYLRNVLKGIDPAELMGDDFMMLSQMSDQALRCAQIIIAVIPILCAYPFLQRYFVSGITLGSVKG